MVTSVLSFLIFVGWLGFGAWAILSFWRSMHKRGMRFAIAELISIRFLLPFMVIGALTIIKLSLVFVYPNQTAVVISVFYPDTGVRPKATGPGLHWVVPLAEKAVLYPIDWHTYTMANRPFEGEQPHTDAITSRTLDSQEVTMDISVVYRIDPEQVVFVHVNWQDRYKEELLRISVRAIMRRQVSQYTVDEVNSDKRNELERMLDADLKKIAARNGIIVEAALLRKISFSKEYASAVEQKQVAFQGEQQKLHEAKQIENLAKGNAAKIEILAAAEAEAIRIKAEAKAVARIVQARADAKALQLLSEALEGKQNLLTYRYISKLSPNVKAIIVPDDVPLIFPLPDMRLPQAAEAAAASPDNSPEQAGEKSADVVKAEF